MLATFARRSPDIRSQNMQRYAGRITDLARSVHRHQALLGAFPRAYRAPVHASGLGQFADPARDGGNLIDVHANEDHEQHWQRQDEKPETRTEDER